MMADVDNAPWLTFLGWGEGGTESLTPASRYVLESADVIFGARRHLRLLPPLDAEVREWPVPFADGIPLLLAERALAERAWAERVLPKRRRKVVMLVSGDPFWFGAGSILARHLRAEEWQAMPQPSTFSLAAAHLGWPLERCSCLGLHARPLTRIRPYLHRGRRLLVLLRDAEAVAELAALLVRLGFGASQLHILEALGGESERLRCVRADAILPDDMAHPLAVGLSVDGDGLAIPLTPGLPDDLFEHDGQITKQTVRAMTLAALAPAPGERLWDIGTGSGSIAIEWLLAHPHNQALAFECDEQRAARARRNAEVLGVDWLEVVEGRAPEVLSNQPLPDAVFVGGGLSQTLLETLWQQLPAGTRLVANAVTLESESLLAHWQQQAGGELLRLELASAAALGTRRGWKGSYPIVQWRVTR